MLKKSHFMVLMVVASLAVLLVLGNMLLFTHNRSLQQQIAGRQQYIQQSVQLETLYQQLIKGTAELATRNNDAQLLSVLTAQGITLSRAPQGESSAPAAPAATPKK